MDRIVSRLRLKPPVGLEIGKKHPSHLKKIKGQQEKHTFTKSKDFYNLGKLELSNRFKTLHGDSHNS